MSYHPVTIARETTREADEVFEALTAVEEPIVFCYPNADAGSRELTVWLTTQNPFLSRADLAGVLGFPEHKLRVIAPDVGGGFGVKGPVYREEIVASKLALEEPSTERVTTTSIRRWRSRTRRARPDHVRHCWIHRAPRRRRAARDGARASSSRS